MKKLLLFLILLLFGFSSTVIAKPFLVCTVLPDESPEILLVFMDEHNVPVFEEVTPTPLHYDLQDLAFGIYRVTAQYKEGVWLGDPSIPLDFTKPNMATPAMGLRLSSE